MEKIERLLSVGSADFHFYFQGRTFVYRDGKRWFFTHGVLKVPASCVENIHGGFITICPHSPDRNCSVRYCWSKITSRNTFDPPAAPGPCPGVTGHLNLHYPDNMADNGGVNSGLMPQGERLQAVTTWTNLSPH